MSGGGLPDSEEGLLRLYGSAEAVAEAASVRRRVFAEISAARREAFEAVAEMTSLEAALRMEADAEFWTRRAGASASAFAAEMAAARRGAEPLLPGIDRGRRSGR